MLAQSTMLAQLTSRLISAKSTKANISENASFVNIHHGDPPIAGSFKVETNTTGDVTFNLKERSSTAVAYSADSLPSGEHKLYAPESVDKIEIDGEVVYEESLFGGGGIGSTQVVVVAIAAAAAVLLFRES